VSILALHGFLGRGSDWDFLRDAGFEVVAPDLFGPAVTPNVSEGPGGARDASRHIRAALPPRPRGPRGALVGYSLGGRLALHVANDYDLAVIISAGITPGDAVREAADDAWARRFESDDWETLIRDWNAQPVFGGHVAHRDEHDFDRRALARALRDWSPAVLMPPDLTTITTRVLWIAGERDAKYVAEGRRAVSLLPNATLAVVEGAGHRVPFERPDAVVALLRDALPLR